MNARQLKGIPDYDEKKFSGYLLWKQSNGFHLRWRTKKWKKSSFQGTLTYQDKILITKKDNIQGDDKLQKAESKTIQWNVKGQDKVVGFNFLTPKSFSLELRINNKKLKPKEIFLGPEMANPVENPLLIDIPAKKRLPTELLELEPDSIPATQTETTVPSDSKPVSKVESRSEKESETELVAHIETDQELTREAMQETDEGAYYQPKPSDMIESEQNTSYEVEVESITEREAEQEPEEVVNSLPAYNNLPESRPKLETFPTQTREDSPDQRITSWLKQLKDHRK